MTGALTWLLIVTVAAVAYGIGRMHEHERCTRIERKALRLSAEVGRHFT